MVCDLSLVSVITGVICKCVTVLNAASFVFAGSGHRVLQQHHYTRRLPSPRSNWCVTNTVQMLLWSSLNLLHHLVQPPGHICTSTLGIIKLLLTVPL
jgi:hypothetical protein